jgi:outer membrane lipoprotein-sorting protein
MSLFDSKPVLRWAVPAVAAVAVIGGGAAVGAISATARSGLPHRSAAQLLVDVQHAKVDGLSGTIVQNADLGLPKLPGVGDSGSSDMSSLVSGSHTLRLWYAGPNKVRLALLGSLGESDIIRNGSDLWTWSSSSKSATHRALPQDHAQGPSPASPTPATPQQAANEALKAITPTTSVSTDGTAVVAGRSAYELLLQPKNSSSLVSSVRIAIDGQTHVPTRVQVFARGASQPAFQVGFTSFDPSRPSANLFRFNPPPGTKVTQDTGRPQPHVGAPAVLPHIVGHGWTSVVVAKTPAGGTTPQAGAPGAGSMTRMLGALPEVSGSWGSGHLLKGSLFSVLLTNDGKVVAGTVPPRMLYDALAGR